MYAIVDIETTGGFAASHRVTEVAIFIHDGVSVVDQYETLINPERFIPANISALTNITNEMVEQAPVFEQVADEIYDYLKGNIFVAHNVHFDYSFLKNEFNELNYKFDFKKLCTVRLSRKIIPGLHSYSLGNLCDSVGIQIESRHRAAGDAKATAKLFGILLRRDAQNHIQKALKRNSRETILPPNLPKEEFEKLPEAEGVYYFHDDKGTPIYIGKAKNIKKRIAGHFTGDRTEKAKQGVRKDIHSISYELTGNEFVALLLEAQEIKKFWPKYNRALKANTTKWGIFVYEDRNGYLRLSMNKANSKLKPEVTFNSHAEAWQFLIKKSKEFELCPKLCGIQKSKGACFDYDMDMCQGACVSKEEVEHYNNKVLEALNSSEELKDTFAIIGKGRNQNENSLVLIENGTFQGFGFVHQGEQIDSYDRAFDFITKMKDNPDIQNIINSQLRRELSHNIMYFNTDNQI
ncbi:MAG: exonuclease domain-containing protein [Bacteroidota bacterium]